MKLGERVRDRISGFEGIVISRAENLHSPPECLVASDSLDSNGVPRANQWFFESRLELKGFEGIKGFTVTK